MKFDANNKLIFLILILFTILSVSLYYLSLQGLKQYEQSTKDLTGKYINNTILATFDDTKKVLTAQLQNAFLDEVFLEALSNKKRDELYSYMKPVYDSIKKVNPGLEVMHFIHPNNDSFIRIHKPKTADNNVAAYKPLIVKVNIEHQIQTGFEAGKFGYYMRLIVPIFNKNKDYLGLVEIGLNTKVILKKLKIAISSDMVILVDKNAIKSKYIKKIKHFYNSYAMVSNTNDTMFLSLIEQKSELLNSGKIIKIKDQYYRSSTVKLKDLNGVSYLVSILNITDTRLFEEKQLMLSLLIILVILISLFFVYKNFRKTIDEKNILIEQTNKTLEQKVIQRTEELTISNTELKKTLTDLTDTKKDLVSAKKMAELGEIVTSMTHEINSPLGIGITSSSHLDDLIKKFSNLYNDGGISKEEFESFLEELKEIVKILNINLDTTKNLVNSFRNIALDQAIEEKRSFNVKEYISEILLALKNKIKNKKIELITECEEQLYFKSYPGFFYQIITNLINNSLLHAFEKQDDGIIKIFVKNLEHSIEITYTDNGKGIPQDLTSKVFDQYFTTKKGQGGTGLGLYIIKEIITEKLSGNIELFPVKKGIKFVITIPNLYNK